MAEVSMVEKVARAIYIEWSRDAGKEESWEELVQHGHSFVDLARREARAAIEAMRINTAEMCKAGRDAIDDAEIGISCGITIDYRSVACWQAMIDAALAEEAKP